MLVVVMVGLAWGRDAELTCPEESGVYPDPEQCDKYWVSQSVYLCVLCLCSYVCVCVLCVCVCVFLGIPLKIRYCFHFLDAEQ